MQANEVRLVAGKSKVRVGDRSDLYWHVYHQGVHAGRVTITRKAATSDRLKPSITVELNKDSRGRGIGTLAFRKASELSGFDAVYASIAKKNVASCIAAERAGFELVPFSRGPGLEMVWRRFPSERICRIRYLKTEFVDANSAMNQLFDLFPDHYPILLEETPDAWIFGLKWPSDPGWYVDSRVEERAKAVFSLKLADLAPFTQVRRCGKVMFVLSMFHSRALLAPAFAVQKDPKLGFSCIVHVDDHTDLMAPLLSVSEGRLHHALTKRTIDLDDPESISEAIDDGVISKGNFLTAYLLGKPAGCLLHVGPNLRPRRAWLIPKDESIPLGGRALAITGLGESRRPSGERWNFKQSSRLLKEIPGRGSGAIWLDVDLDAFCNRYNGDSDRGSLVATEEETQTMRWRIRDFLDALAVAKWRKRIRAVSVAASPGFFPSEYWNEAIPAVCDGIIGLLK